MPSQVEKEIEIKKVAKRIGMLIREMEVAGLDIMMNSKVLSKDGFPTKYFKDTHSVLEDYATEAHRIFEAWGRIFQTEIEAKEEPKEPVKKTRKRK